MRGVFDIIDDYIIRSSPAFGDITDMINRKTPNMLNADERQTYEAIGQNDKSRLANCNKNFSQTYGSNKFKNVFVGGCGQITQIY